MSEFDKCAKLFNTTIIATKIPKSNTSSNRLNALLESPAFEAILNSIQRYAHQSGLSEEKATEDIIRTFREIDCIWNDYIFQEGLEQIKSNLS